MMAILETMIGIVFVFTLVSLVCSVVVEWLSGILSVRGKNLRRGMESMLGPSVAREVRKHKLLDALKRETWVDSLPGLARFRSKPSYVPKETFATALLAIVRGEEDAVDDVVTLRARVKKWPGSGRMKPAEVAEAKQAIQALVDEAGSLEEAKQNLQDWFQATMDRAKGWYKRWAQLTLFVVGFFIALLVGVDAIAITKALWTNPDLRQTVADAAAEYVRKDPDQIAAPNGEAEGEGAPSGESGQTPALEDVVEEIQALTQRFQAERLPLYPWGQSPPKDAETTRCVTLGSWLANLRLHLLGFLLTALATSLGAQFWFDLLSKLVKLRAAGSSPEESDAESKKGSSS